MKSLVAQASTCWDWSHLVRLKPERKHTDAFLGLCSKLLPLLTKTPYPEGPMYACVPKELPQDLSRGGPMHWQYLYLVGRVRAALKATRCRAWQHAHLVPAEVLSAAGGWLVTDYLWVTPLLVWTPTWKAFAPWRCIFFLLFFSSRCHILVSCLPAGGFPQRQAHLYTYSLTFESA